MKDLFLKWNPLNPATIEHGCEQLRSWRSLLSNKGAVFNETDSATAYDLLLWHAWMPVVQRAAIHWDPRTNYLQMIELVATWVPILPSWLQDNLFDNVIVPRIRDKVDEWDPINDEIAIDTWVIPWHEILGDRLLIVYPLIRQKLAKALRHWQAKDLT
jgi:tuftelin-interacting protein 11